ncbi:oligoribonuclease [Buchnera aphidicola (Periphyllus koelreuteriae)]|uniref:oligoribonuclease n=1 Tax=Buchnera aphidicola TaxID=9 RepID=UPI0031B85EEF
MKKNNKKNNLIWIDLEMTGLCSKKNKILEIAIIITDSNLNILTQDFVICIYQSLKHIQKMNDWNKKTHFNSGLIKKVQNSKYTESSAEKKIIQFLKKWTIKKKSPICGNTIWKDREFLKKYMPKVESYLNYRNLDVSTIQELYSRWKPIHSIKFKKKNKHSALYDIKESIEELLFYKKKFFNI